MDSPERKIEDFKDTPSETQQEHLSPMMHVEDAEKLHGKYGTTDVDDYDVKLTMQTWFVLFAISILSLAVSLAITGPSGLTTYIVRDLGDSADASWISTASTCLQAAVSMPIAFVTDLYGRRWMLIFTTCCAIVGTFVSGSAHSMQQVIAGQCITGFCLATKPLCYAIGSEVLPRKYRGLIQLWIGQLALIGQLIGALAGPSFVDRNSVDGWRWFFYLEGGIFILSLVALLIFYRPPPRDTVESSFTFRQKLASLDIIGWILQAGGFIMFLVGLTWGGGGKYPWKSGHVLGLLVTGLGLLVCFALYEWKGRSDGLAPHALFRERNYAISLVAIFVEGMILFSFLTEYSAEVLKLWTTSAFNQGLRLSGFSIAGMIATPIWSLFVMKWKNVQIPLIISFIFFLISSVLLATATVRTSTQSIIADCMAGIAYSCPLAFLIVTAQLSIPPKYIGVGSALLATCRATGSSMSVAVYNSVLNPKLAKRVNPYISKAALGAGLPAANVPAAVTATVAGIASNFSPTKLKAVPHMTTAIVNACFAAARQAYQESYHYVWIVVAALSGLGILLMLPFSDVAHHLNAQIDAPAEDVHAHKAGAAAVKTEAA